MNHLRTIAISLLTSTLICAAQSLRQRQNTDFDWRFHLGDAPAASAPEFADTS